MVFGKIQYLRDMGKTIHSLGSLEEANREKDGHSISQALIWADGQFISVKSDTISEWHLGLKETISKLW